MTVSAHAARAACFCPLWAVRYAWRGTVPTRPACAFVNDFGNVGAWLMRLGWTAQRIEQWAIEAKRKERLAHRPIACDYSEHTTPNARKALKESTQTLRAKPKSNAGRELPMEEENGCTGMTTDEMQRFFDIEAEQETSELEAYRKLMRILGIEFPSKE